MSFAALQLWKRDRLPTFTKILETAFRGLDAFTKKLPITSLRQPAPHTVGKEFDVEELLEYLSVFASKYSLRPHYDERSLGWLLDTLFRQHRWGSLQKVGVYNQHDKLLGWYIYYLNTTRPSQVLQIGARENTIDQVLEHLFYHAWERGAVEIEGRLNPHFMKAFYRKFSFVFPGRDWMLVHSKNPELLQSVFRADAWLTRLEGDLWLL